MCITLKTFKYFLIDEYLKKIDMRIRNYGLIVSFNAYNFNLT